MIPRILSIAAPLFIYVTLALVLWALWRQKKKFEWWAILPAFAGLAASFLFLEPIHRLFFDEDIYINIASNLTNAPVAQVTLLGAPNEISISTYYKEPAGWPLILSLLFMVTGRSEAAAFAAARIFYALAIAAIYMTAREITDKQYQALIAAVVFGAGPICFWFSASAGTDIPAVFFATLGLWGLLAGSGPLAASGFAMAAQVRLEMIVLVPLVWITSRIPTRWKVITLGLVAAQIIHILWVLSVAPVLEEAERVEAAFALGHVVTNLPANVKYLFNPMVFPAAATVLAIFSLRHKRALRRSNRFGVSDSLTRPPSAAHPLPVGEGRALKARGVREWLTPKRLLRDARSAVYLHIAALLAIYLLFYAGSFEINPRYSIQLLAPLAILAASFRKSYLILPTLILPYLQSYEIPSYVRTLAADHRFAQEFVTQVRPDDLVVSMEQEMFINQGVRAMSSVFASERPERLREEIGKPGRVLYHSGARTNVRETQAWRADRWLRSNFELQLIDSREYGGLRIAYYELVDLVNREAR